MISRGPDVMRQDVNMSIDGVGRQWWVRFPIALVIAVLALVLPTAFAPSASAQQPQESDVSILMIGVSGLDLQAGTFDATFYLGVTCSEACEAQDWEFVNAKRIDAQLTTETPSQKWWRVTGTFVFQPDLRLFPFDTQRLTLVLENKNFNAEQLVYVPNIANSEVDAGVGVPGWFTEPFSFTSTVHDYPALDESYSQVDFTIPVGRGVLAGITKYYIPLLIFIILGAATLVLVRSDFQIRTGGTALVGLTIFYLASSGGVGTAGYLTLWDVSMLVGYLALGLVLTCGIIGAYQFHEGLHEGPEGQLKAKRQRFGFLAAVIAVVVIGFSAIAAVAVLT
jgi:hypothetical protein